MAKPAKLAYYINQKRFALKQKLTTNMNKTWILLHLHCSIHKSAEVPEFPRLHTNFHSHNINTAHVVRCRDDTWTQCIDTSWYTFGGGCRWKSWEFGDSKTTQNYCKIPSSILVYECQFTEYTCKIMAKIEYFYHLESASQHGHMATRLGRWAMCCSSSCFGRRYVAIQPGSNRNPTYNRLPTVALFCWYSCVNYWLNPLRYGFGVRCWGLQLNFYELLRHVRAILFGNLRACQHGNHRNLSKKMQLPHTMLKQVKSNKCQCVANLNG